VILLLHTPKGALTAFAYVAGMVTSMMVQGIIFAFLFSIVGLTTDQSQDELATVASVLFVVVGIIMLVGALKFVFQEEDDDQPPPKWLEQLESLTPRQAFATGFGWLMVSPKQWVFVLTAVAVVFMANLSVAASFVNFFLFAVLIQLVYMMLIAIYLIMPERSAAILDSLFN
jgi:threonine/homoserine/homoserine lactone efflux protein